MLVHTNSGTVEVTGTTFNVYSRENKTKVYLREGKVKLNNLPDLPVIHMHPGDYIQYDVLDKTISKIRWHHKLLIHGYSIKSFTIKHRLQKF